MDLSPHFDFLSEEHQLALKAGIKLIEFIPEGFDPLYYQRVFPSTDADHKLLEKLKDRKVTGYGF